MRSTFCLLKPSPLINIPPHSCIYPLGVVPNATQTPLLKFSKNGLLVPSEGKMGLAIVGDGEGRRLLVDVSWAHKLLAVMTLVDRILAELTQYTC